jgi:hypothetical protein
MKDNTFGKLMLGGSFIFAIIIMLASCVFVAWKPEQHFTSPEEEVAEEETLPPLTPFDLISEE